MEERIEVLEKYIKVLEHEVATLNDALSENKDYLIELLEENESLKIRNKELEEKLVNYLGSTINAQEVHSMKDIEEIIEEILEEKEKQPFVLTHEYLDRKICEFEEFIDKTVTYRSWIYNCENYFEIPHANLDEMSDEDLANYDDFLCELFLK